VHLVHFTRGATNPIENFGARRVRFVPLARGESDRDPTVSCYHIGAGGRIAEVPSIHESALLVVHGYVTFSVINGGRANMSAGMGMVLNDGEHVRLESDTGAIIVAIESPTLDATAQGISSPERIFGQVWPGERRPWSLRGVMRSMYYRFRWKWQFGLGPIRRGSRRIA
jgi:hypothetical protein